MTQNAYFYLGALALACAIAAVFTASYVVAIALVIVGAILIAYGNKATAGPR